MRIEKIAYKTPNAPHIIRPLKHHDDKTCEPTKLNMMPMASYSLFVTREKAVNNKINRSLRELENIEKETLKMCTMEDSDLKALGINRKIQAMPPSFTHEQEVTFDNYPIKRVFIKKDGTIIRTDNDLYDSSRGIFAHNITVSQNEEDEKEAKVEDLIVKDSVSENKVYLLRNYRVSKERKASRIYLQEDGNVKQLRSGRKEYKHALKISPSRYELTR